MRTGAFSPESGWETVGFVNDGLTTGCRRTGGTALVRYSVAQAHVRGGFAPAAEPWALAGQVRPDPDGFAWGGIEGDFGVGVESRWKTNANCSEIRCVPFFLCLSRSW